MSATALSLAAALLLLLAPPAVHALEAHVATEDGVLIVQADSVSIVTESGSFVLEDFYASTLDRLEKLEKRLGDLSDTVDEHAGTLETLDGRIGDQETALEEEGADVAAVRDRVGVLEHEFELEGNLVEDSDLVDTQQTWTDPVEPVRAVWRDGNTIYAHKSLENDQTGCYNWAVSNKFDVDTRRTYRFSVWIKTSKANSLANYLGFYLYDADGNQISGAWNNPYFRAGGDSPAEWVFHSGLLASTDTPHDDDMRFGSDATTGVNWVMSPNAVKAAVRFGSCYGDGQNGDFTLFAFPKVSELVATAVDEVRDDIDATAGENLVAHANMLNAGHSWLTPPQNLESVTFMDGRQIHAQKLIESDNGDPNSCYDGWSQTNQFEISPFSAYEFGIWIKTNDVKMNNYLGFFLFDESGNRIGGTWNNPYFHTSETSASDVDTWRFLNGYLLSADTPGAVDGRVAHPFTNGEDWVMAPNARSASLRFGSCYAESDGNGVTYYYAPSVREVIPGRLEETGILQWANSADVQYVGRMNVAVPTNLIVTAPWGTWTQISDGRGVGFSFENYQSHVGQHQILMFRICMSYSDSGTTGRSQVGIRRIAGADSGYPALTMFHWSWFANTWSGSGLLHHQCGDWAKVSDLSCGYSWSNTCHFVVRHEQGAPVRIEELDLELGVKAKDF